MYSNFIYIFVVIFILLFFLGILIFSKKSFDTFLNKFKIREKITISFLVLFLLVIISTITVIEFFNYTMLENSISKQLQSLAMAKSSHIQTYFEQSIERLKLITSRTALRKTLVHYNESPNPEDIASITATIKDASASIKDFERVCILNLEGIVVASTNEKFIGRNVYDKTFFIEGQKKEGVYFIKEDGVYKIFISGPMIFENNLIGVGITVITLDNLLQIVHSRIGLGETGEIVVAFLDEQGQRTYPLTRLFESEAIDISLQSEKTSEAMKQALLGKNIFFNNALDYRNKTVFAASSYVNIAKLGLVVKIDNTEAMSEIRSSVMIILLLVLIFILIYYLVSSYIAGFLTRSLGKLREGVIRVEEGKLDFKVNLAGNDEVSELARGFNVMIDKIKNSRLDIDNQVKNQMEEIKTKSIEMQNQQKSILNILEDVEEEKSKVDALAKDLEKFKLAVDNASDHIHISDSEGTILYANKAVEKFTGYPLAEVLGKTSRELWRKSMDQKLHEKLWQTIRKDKKPFIGQNINIRKNGETYETLVSISPMLNNKGEAVYYVCIERDITKEKEIDRAKSEFVSLASHQLRTPLSTINWYTEMLLNGDAGKLEPEQTDYLKEIYKGNQRMVDLVNALLNVSRLDLGTFIVEPKLLDIFEIAEIAIDELNHKIKEKNIKFSKKYDKSIEKMKLDEKLTLIIFQNLLSNAVKYTPDGGSVSLEINKKGKDLQIRVVDTGMGIPLSQQDKIFNKMFRADNVRATDTEGTGLGLYIVKKILDHAGGKVWFKSEKNQGTDFHVTIPLTGMQKKDGSRELDVK